MDATTWYGNQADANVEGRNIGTLAVIAPLLERMKVAEIINQHRNRSQPSGVFSRKLIWTRMSVLCDNNGHGTEHHG